MQIPRDPRLLNLACIVAFFYVAAVCAMQPAPDFRAFYCAGSTVAAGQDPYRMEPLRSCERVHGQGSYLFQHNGVMPAPLPAYDLAGFALLARLPYDKARMFWQALLWASTALSIMLLRKVAGIAPPTAVAVLLFSQGMPSSVLGNLATIACMGLILALHEIGERRPLSATLGMLIATCEPHIAIGAWVAALLFVPAMRPPMLLGAIMLGALSFAGAGATLVPEYFRDVLPQHARAEIAHEEQFSLTSVLHLIGASDRIALAGGDLSLLITIVAGLFVARRLRDRFHNDALLIAVPTAFSLIGGPFLHYPQLAAALPAALLLHKRLPERRIALGWAIMLLATPWLAVHGVQYLAVVLLLSIFLLCRTYMPTTDSAIYAWLAQTTVIFISATMFHNAAPRGWRMDFPPSALNEEAWRVITDSILSQRVLFYTMLKIPSWCGLLIVAWCAIEGTRSLSRRPPQERPLPLAPHS